MSLEGEENNTRECYINTEKSGEEDTDIFLVTDDYQDVEMNEMPQVSEHWEQQDFQPSGNSGEKQDNLAAKQVTACSTENVPWKLRDHEKWQYATSELDRNYNVNVPHMNMPGESENQEENMINYNIPMLSYTGGPEMRGGNIYNPQVVQPRYVGEPEMRGGNIYNPQVVQPRYVGGLEMREGNIYYPQAVQPRYVGAPEMREENIYYPQAVQPRYVGAPEMRGGNIYNPQVVQPRYVGGPEMREGNIYYPQAVHPRYVGGPEMRGGNIYNPQVVQPRYVGGPEMREENIYYPQAVQPRYVGAPEMREENIYNPQIVQPRYVGGPEMRGGNIYYPQAVQPRYVGGPEMREENIYYPQAVQPRYVGGLERRGGNIYNPQVVQPRYVGGPEMRGGNIYYPQAVQPQYVGGLERRGGNIYNPQAIEPFYPGGPEERNSIMVIPNVMPAPSDLVPVKPEIRDENLINYYVPVPVSHGGPEKREESMVYPNVLMPSYSEGPQKRERNIFIPQTVERIPSYARRQENKIHDLDERIAALRMRDGGIVNPVVPERPSDVVEPANLYSPHIAEPLYAGGSEMRGGSMVNPCDVMNHCGLNSINKYESHDTSRTWHLNLNKENNLIEEFMNKQKDPQYIKMQQFRTKFPAWSQKDYILKAIRENPVVIISGETGCGKSTQIPQFVLDDWIIKGTQNEDKLHVNIICIQPREINAVALAERIAAERTDIVGDVVGYHVHLEKRSLSRTRLTFCTTGILLHRLIVDPNLTVITHVIVDELHDELHDEVHERAAESDFLLMILKDLLLRRPSLKIILISATLNANRFSSYFGHAPVLSIPGTSLSV